MSNFWEILKNDDATYYEWRDNEVCKKTTVWHYCIFRVLIFSILAILFVIFGDFLENDALEALTSMLSILIGFSVTVLFYIMSTFEADQKEVHSEKKALNQTGNYEKLARLEDRNKMRKEIFANVNYFVLIAVLCLLSSILAAIPSISNREMAELLGKSHFQAIFSLSLVRDFGVRLNEFVLVFLLVAAVHSFIRFTKRIAFLFRLHFDEPETP